jgi:hypothetical protein
MSRRQLNFKRRDVHIGGATPYVGTHPGVLTGAADQKLLLRNEYLVAEPDSETLYVQQVVERVARALLTHAGVAFGTSHNLGQMAEALPLEHPFRERIRAFDAFSSAVTAFPPARQEHPEQSLTRAETWPPCACSLQDRKLMVQDDEFQQQIKGLAEPRPHCRKPSKDPSCHSFSVSDNAPMT